MAYDSTNEDSTARNELTADEHMRLECARMVADRHAYPEQNVLAATALYRFVAGIGHDG